MTASKRCVFYRTQQISDESRFGSGVRPAKLLKAFRQLGYDVDVVAGSAAARKRAMQVVKQKASAGVEYDFLYAEPPTTPIPLNESHHLPTHPLLDYRFLGFCHALEIPVVLFYCDIQWRLPDYPRRVGWWKYLAALPFFHLDLLVYRRVVDAWLVPDVAMLPQIASWLPSRPHWASIPGFDPLEVPPPRQARAPGAPLRLFYVGGVEPPVYDLEPVLEGSALAASRGVKLELTICCRELEWARHPEAYDRFLGPNVTVVHNRNRQELLELYARHDVAVMPYGTLNSDWAMPVKFPEAIGMGLPLLAGSGTAVAKVVEAQGTGWSVGVSAEEFHDLVKRIGQDELEGARAAVQRVRPHYAWTERALEIAAIADRLRAERDHRVSMSGGSSQR